jgi:hypothetical protein
MSRKDPKNKKRNFGSFLALSKYIYSSMTMHSNGHASTQAAQPVHVSGRTRADRLSTSSSELLGQLSIQIPQPVQQSLSIFGFAIFSPPK